MNPGGNGVPGGQDSSVKISVHFITVYPLKKPNFSSVWHGPSLTWVPFEHSITKMGSLDNQPLYSTLCPSITCTHSTSNFHSNTFQYVSSLVMLDTFTYGKDRTVYTYSSLLSVRTITIQRKQPGQCAQIPSKVRSRRILELRAAELE